MTGIRSDLLDPAVVMALVRQYGTESYQTGCAERHDEAAVAEHDDASRALYARIEAEVQRLRDEHAQCAGTIATIRASRNFNRDRYKAAQAELERVTALADLLEAQRRDAWAHVHALDAIAPQQDGPVVLTLPEAPEGAIALTGNRTGSRYRPSEKPEQPDWWYFDTDRGPTSGFENIGHVLAWEHPHGVTVEMAPPPAPRTAAEIWYGMASREAMQVPRELAEALDREAGLAP
jgi:hypothetical protein